MLLAYRPHPFIRISRPLGSSFISVYWPPLCCLYLLSVYYFSNIGIVSMIFNILMNKFEEEKRYKYVIEDVKQYFDE